MSFANPGNVRAFTGCIQATVTPLPILQGRHTVFTFSLHSGCMIACTGGAHRVHFAILHMFWVHQAIQGNSLEAAGNAPLPCTVLQLLGNGCLHRNKLVYYLAAARAHVRVVRQCSTHHKCSSGQEAACRGPCDEAKWRDALQKTLDSKLKANRLYRKGSVCHPMMYSWNTICSPCHCTAQHSYQSVAGT